MTGAPGRSGSTPTRSTLTTIDGQNIHFVHVRSPEPDALPLILTHGWPNSVRRVPGADRPLTDPRAHGGDPADAFDVVIPSIPGFAFSGPTREPGWNRYRTARAWAELMERLGYDRYGTHGNDAGAIRGARGRPASRPARSSACTSTRSSRSRRVTPPSSRV